jgi:hypothetical protein
MKNSFVRHILLTALVLAAMTACQSMVMDQLKTASAGHTGCTPDQITISNLTSHDTFLSPGETWNATCNGKLYLCSAVGGTPADSSCALAAK